MGSGKRSPILLSRLVGGTFAPLRVVITRTAHVSAHSESISEDVNATIMTEKQLLEALPALSRRQLRRLRSERKLPFLRIGHRSFLYDSERVLEALRKLEVTN
jgi:homoserine acetyltransferase